MQASRPSTSLNAAEDQGLAFLERWCRSQKVPTSGYRAELTGDGGSEWDVVVDLRGTPIERIELGANGWQRRNDWVFCWIEGGLFHGVGGPDNIQDILATFRWAAERGAGVGSPPVERLDGWRWLQLLFESFSVTIGMGMLAFHPAIPLRVVGGLVAVGYSLVWWYRDRRFLRRPVDGPPVRGDWWQRRTAVQGRLPQRPARMAYEGAAALGSALAIWITVSLGFDPPVRAAEGAVGGVMALWYTSFGLRAWGLWKVNEVRKARLQVDPRRLL